MTRCLLQPISVKTGMKTMKTVTFVKSGAAVLLLLLTSISWCFANQSSMNSELVGFVEQPQTASIQSFYNDQPLTAGFSGASHLETTDDSGTNHRHLPELDAVILMLLGLVGLGLSRRSVNKAG